MDTIATSDVDWVARTAQCLERVDAKAPQVHVLTSTVAQSLSANLLLAVGAQPSLSQAPGQIEAFAERTDALVANLGVLDAARRDAIGRALPILQARAVPWVLDPVKVERSPERAAFAATLIAERPTVVRGNAFEMDALEGDGAPVWAVTGEIDLIEHGDRWVRVANGHALMTRVTAMGCAGTTLIAAFLTVERDPFVAAVTALLALGVAGEMAAEQARGPGTFPAAFLDALHHLDADTLDRRARLR